MSANFNEMNELSRSELFLSSKIIYGKLPIMRSIIIMNLMIGFYLFYKIFLIWSLSLIFFSFLKSIELVSYFDYKNWDFVQFVTIYNFMFCKCGRSTELQKSANETMNASRQISLTIFIEAKSPIYSSTYSGQI